MKKRHIDKELEKEEEQLFFIKCEVDSLYDKFIDKKIQHFSKRDVINAIYGALVIGLTFVFKGLMVEIGMSLPWFNILMIVFSTLLILSSEIYFVGYSRVKDKKHRPLGQFMAKRLVTMYTISLSVSVFLLLIFGFMLHMGSLENFIKLVFVIAMPCAIGAAIPSMLKSE
ncbi:MAG: DUF2391 family protein [Candidatus Woesearchaeota archaeon]